MLETESARRFHAALALARADAEAYLGHPTPRTIQVELRGAGFANARMTPEEALAALYHGPEVLPVVVDVAAKSTERSALVVILMVSGRPRVDDSRIWDPEGIGPFKHVMALSVDEAGLSSI